MRPCTRTLTLFLLILAATPVQGLSQIPLRPEQLEYKPVTFDTPSPTAFKRDLENGIPVFIGEDKMFPLVSILVYTRGGQYVEPEGKEGLAALTGSVWRTGGAGDLEPQVLDEELEFLSAELSTGVGGTFSSVSLNLLSKDLDRGLELLMDVLLRPRFDQKRLDKAKDDLLTGMKRRNDETSDIESREWNRILYGDDYWLNQLPTEQSVRAIVREDLIAFQKRMIDPRNIVLAVSGDFAESEMLAKLEATFGQLKALGDALPEVPQPKVVAKPGVYLVNKADVNQGRVSIGHLGFVGPAEDEFALAIANDVLGGGDFTSWIVSRVRSDEGLAYSAGSYFSIGVDIPGEFRAFFQSKSSTCARAAQIIIDLVAKLQSEGVSEKELGTSKASQIQTFPNRFRSIRQTVSLFARDALTGRPPEYWSTFREKVAQVGIPAVKQAATERIKGEQFVILVVGNVEEILKGHPDFPGVSFEKMGQLIRVPLRDPMSLEPIRE